MSTKLEQDVATQVAQVLDDRNGLTPRGANRLRSAQLPLQSCLETTTSVHEVLLCALLLCATQEEVPSVTGTVNHKQRPSGAQVQCIRNTSVLQKTK